MIRCHRCTYSNCPIAAVHPARHLSIDTFGHVASHMCEFYWPWIGLSTQTRLCPVNLPSFISSTQFGPNFDPFGPSTWANFHQLPLLPSLSKSPRPPHYFFARFSTGSDYLARLYLRVQRTKSHLKQLPLDGALQNTRLAQLILRLFPISDHPLHPSIPSITIFFNYFF